MYKSTIAILLSLSAGIAQADGFAPWDARGVAADTAGDATTVAPVGFAPWRDRVQPVDVTGGVRYVDQVAHSVFRPWS